MTEPSDQPSLHALFEQAHGCAPPPDHDVFLFAGNDQESVPQALFFDRRLTPIERNAWQIIKMMMKNGNKATMPTYERLRPFLTASPCATKASYETVAKAIILLRLTRWMTLVRRHRLPNGQVQSNVYVLHDEPLTPHEAIQLDHDYFSLVSKAIDHNSKAICRVGEICLAEISHDPTLGQKVLPTRLSVLIERVARTVQPEKLSTDKADSESEDSKIDRLRNRYGLTSDSEAGLKPAQNRAFPIPKSVRSSSSNIINKTTTTASAVIAISERLAIQLPQQFLHLSKKQQNLALTSMQHLEVALQQQIFIEWEKRCESMSIRKPAAYLMGIIQKALQGNLNALSEAPLKPSPPSTSSSQSTSPPSAFVSPKPRPVETAAERKTALKHIRQLRSIVARGTLKPPFAAAENERG